MRLYVSVMFSLFFTLPGHPLYAGPTSEAQLFDDLDLSQPELVKVADAWRTRNIAAAEKAFATYLRERTTVNWGGSSSNSRPVLSPASQSSADNAVLGKVQGGAVPPVYAFPNGKIDWYYNARSHISGMSPDNEWQWQLNRMGFWGDMASAFRSNQDERYAEALVSQFLSWIAACPVPDKIANGVGSTWRTIDSGIRVLGPWPDVFFALRHSSTMTDHDLMILVASFHDHGAYLRKFHTTLNWITMEMGGLYSVGTLFPEFKEAADWRQYAVNVLSDYTQSSFLPDGAEIELSTGYQSVVMMNLTRVNHLANWNHRLKDLPASYLNPVERAYDWEMFLAAPTLQSPKVNDSWDVQLPHLFEDASTYFPARDDFRWLARSRKSGTAPHPASVFLGWSGYAAMRSDWTAEGNYVLFHPGPMGAGHMHQDKLNVLLWSYGRELLYDSGGGSYEQSKWRDWGISTFSHNSVIVDGLAQSPPQNVTDKTKDSDYVSQSPLDGHWQSNPVFDFASGQYKGAYGPQRVKPATHQRDVLFLKPDLTIVADRMNPSDSTTHQYEARWQLLTTHSTIDRGTQVLQTTDANVPNAVIAPLLSEGISVRSASGQEQPEILGWELFHAGTPERTPATTLLHARSGTGRQLLLTMILSLKAGEGNPIASIAPASDRISTVVILKDGRHIKVSAGKNFGIQITETLADGSRGRSAMVN